VSLARLLPQFAQDNGEVKAPVTSAGTNLKWSKPEILEKAIKRIIQLEDGEESAKKVRLLRRQNR